MKYETEIKKAVADHLPADYDWRLYWAQLKKESYFDPMAVSPVGAMGVAQFMPATWAEWGAGDSLDAQASIDAGARYMAWLIKRWTAERPEIDRYCLAMASYNAGFGNILDAQRAGTGQNDYAGIIKNLVFVTGEKNSHETTTYVRRILGYWADKVTG
jgi:membrane-bound lytic murein transglycosylase MltF